MKLALAGGTAGDESVMPPPTSPAGRVAAGFGAGVRGRPGSARGGEGPSGEESPEPSGAERQREVEGLDGRESDAEESGLAMSLVQSAIAGAIENMTLFGALDSLPDQTQTQPPADSGEAELAAPGSRSPLPPPANTRQNPLKLGDQPTNYLGALQEDNEESDD